MIPGNILKEFKSKYNSDTCTPVIITVLSAIAKLWKQPQCPKNHGWVKKMWHIYTTEYYS
jgi:hypothetical protein